MMDEDCSAELFTKFSPDDFDFSAATAIWEQPCWICISTSFRAVTELAKSQFWLPLKFEFRVDPFARRPAHEQLGAQFWRLYEHGDKLGGRIWSDFLCRRVEEFHRPLDDTKGLMEPPMQSVSRSEFQKAPLDAVLARDPETMVIYVAEDTNSYGHDIYTLRIHSSLWYYSPDQSYLWYQKTLPSTLHPEDVLPWFHATVRRLPKKSQPRDLDGWDEELVRAEPDLAQPTPKLDGEWGERSKLALIFGTRDQVGHAALYHLERERIQRLVRFGSRISIRASIDSQYEKDPKKLCWTFHLLTPSSLHAQRLEGRLLSGGQIHFGLGDDISGMIACHRDCIEAINVDPITLKRLCWKEGKVIALVSAPRFKHKSYEYWPENEPLPAEFNGTL